MSAFRRLRGVVGTAITWALGWTGIGVIHGTLLFLWSRRDGRLLDIPWSAFVANQAQLFCLLGATAGSVFAVGLWLGERGKSARKLGVGRAAGWGILAATVYPTLLAWRLDLGLAGFLHQFGVPTLIALGLGAASAALMVGLAKRGADPTRALEAETIAALPDAPPSFGADLVTHPKRRPLHDDGSSGSRR